MEFSVCRGVHLTCTSLMVHAKVSDWCLWQLAASYWFRLKFVSRCVRVAGEKLSKSMQPALFRLSSTVQFSSNVICAAFSSWPSSNSPVQFCCCLELVIHSGEQNYPFAAFKAIYFSLLIWKEAFCKDWSFEFTVTGLRAQPSRPGGLWLRWYHIVITLSVTQMHLGLLCLLITARNANFGNLDFHSPLFLEACHVR